MWFLFLGQDFAPSLGGDFVAVAAIALGWLSVRSRLSGCPLIGFIGGDRLPKDFPEMLINQCS